MSRIVLGLSFFNYERDASARVNLPIDYFVIYILLGKSDYTTVVGSYKLIWYGPIINKFLTT
jgi:hypothetical protein